MVRGRRRSAAHRIGTLHAQRLLPHHSRAGGLNDIEVTYDGACPVCRSVVQRLKARSGEPRISLIDARAAPEQVAALAARGLDLDEGIVVKAGEEYFSGAEATRYLARLHAPAGWLERFAARGFASPRRAALFYPLFRALRRVLLFLLGRAPIRKRG